MPRPADPPTRTSPIGAAPADLSGRLIGKYRFEGVLGRGTMGVVYRATDTVLDRPVAVKVPALDDPRDGELVGRLVREARAAAGLPHPGIGRVYEIFEAGGGPAVAMEFVDGRSLSAALSEDGPLDPRHAALVAADLADALSAAHAEGLIHRDVKPANVMLRGDGSPVLLDFGLVWAAESGDLSRLTQDGTSVGSPAYMSPEQVAGAELTPRSDVYNLGVTLYEMLTGDVPFKGTVSAVVAQTLHNAPPPVTKLRRGIPRRVADCCHRAIAKDPGDRFASAAEFARHLRAAAEGRDPLTSDRISSIIAAVPPATRPAAGRRVLVAAAVTAATVTAAAVTAGVVLAAVMGGDVPDATGDSAAEERRVGVATVPVSASARPEGPNAPRPRLEIVRRRVIDAAADEPFETFDSDGDGLLGPHEILLHVLNRADADGDRLLTRREYEDALAARGGALFDPPADGERRDPLEILMSLGPPPAE